MTPQVLLYLSALCIFIPTSAGFTFKNASEQCSKNVYYDYYLDLESGDQCETPDVDISSPIVGDNGCFASGVLKIKLGKAAVGNALRRKAVIIDLVFDNPRDYSFHLGDSVSNDGLGRDGGHTKYDTELHPYQHRGFSLYENKYGSYQKKTVTQVFETRLTLYIRDGRVEWVADKQSDLYESPNLFVLEGQDDDTLYLGLNRVVSETSSRSGSGLCKVGVRFTTDSNAYYDAKYNLRTGVACDSPWVEVAAPFAESGCSTRGVLKILMNSVADGPYRRAAIFDLEFAENVTVWAFNLGDSPTNNGIGGDSGDTEYDAEIHNWDGKGIRVYKNDKATFKRNGKKKYIDNFSNRLTIYVADETLQWMSETDLHSMTGPHLFALGGQTDDAQSGGVPDYNLYLGMNKAIHSSKRLGSGLCSVSIRWMMED